MIENNNEELLLDLLYKEAVHGLTEEETRELARLENSDANVGSLEMTVARIGLIDLDTRTEMPQHLQAKILAEADKYFAKETVPDRRNTVVFEEAPRRSFMDWFGWAVAAAACIALAFNIYLTRGRDITIAGNPTPTPVVAPMTPEQKRDQFMGSAPDLAKAAIGAGTMKDIAGVSGDIVWSDDKQTGYIRVKGLPKNDVSKQTYQLWIFEENQGDKTPVDGGTFDINADGEVIIPIDAKLNAKNPKMFAITMEKAGGVVVSDRGKIAALAKLETSS